MRQLLIMRDLPGSGKTTLAKFFINKVSGRGHGYVHCSADQHFVDARGVYTFKPDEIGVAHFLCQKYAFDAMQAGVNLVVVDNTNVQRREYAVYLWMAKQFGYEPRIVEANAPWARDVAECAKRNVHGVPEATIQAMLDRWEGA